MILNNTIILTIEDFRRHFDFSQFWAKRKHFVRDMHPQKIFYYNPEQEQDYWVVKEWLETEDNNITIEKRKTGINALSRIIDREISQSELSSILVTINYDDDIIIVKSGKTINLPGSLVDWDYPHSNAEKLHKVEAVGDDGDVKIMIGGSHAYTLHCKECVYITEIGGSFMRVLPTSCIKGATSLKLINIPGQFSSKLEITKYNMGKHVSVEDNVTQFALEGMRVLYNADNYLII